MGPPRVVGTGTASPPHTLDRRVIVEWGERLLGDTRRYQTLVRLTDLTGIERRQLALPVERTVVSRSFEERNREFAEHAVPLATMAARRALDRARVDGSEVDFIVTTSCTGVLIPSLDALIAPRLGLRSDVVRLPITELGCAAGAAAIARAREHLLAFPDHVALVIAVELTSLTFQLPDESMTNLVAASIFGDGAGAAVLRCNKNGAARDAGPTILDTMSHLWPDTTRLMGFDVSDGGFHIVLDRAVPKFLAGRVRPLVQALCSRNNLAPADLAFAVLHPGGKTILHNLERELLLPDSATAPSRSVLRDHGNMSSATVLFVLDRVMRLEPAPPIGSHGLLAAFGPGFSAELALLRWDA